MKNIKEIAKDVTNVRYGEIGQIIFTFKGTDYIIKEPSGVILVGYLDLAAEWFVDRYWYLLPID
jgi:hypothetical protein